MSEITHREISPQEFVKEIIKGYRLTCFGFKNVNGEVIQILKVDHPIKEGTALGLRAWVADGRGDGYVEVVNTESDVFSGIFRGCLLQEKDIYVYGDIQGSFVVFEGEKRVDTTVCNYVPSLKETSIEDLKNHLIGKFVYPFGKEWIRVTGVTKGKLFVGETLEGGELEAFNLQQGDCVYDGKLCKEITANPAWVGGGI